MRLVYCDLHSDVLITLQYLYKNNIVLQCVSLPKLPPALHNFRHWLRFFCFLVFACWLFPLPLRVPPVLVIAFQDYFKMNTWILWILNCFNTIMTECYFHLKMPLGYGHCLMFAVSQFTYKNEILLKTLNSTSK